MQQNTKQRVVGILVILIAAIVLLPVVFDGQGSYQLPLESRIPEPALFPVPPTVTAERPTILADGDAIRIDDSVDEAAPHPDAVDADPAVTAETPVDAPVAVATVQVTPQSTPAESIVSVSEPLGLDSAGLPQGWSVRLGSFSSTANALNLVDRLQERGHRAYTREVSSAQGTLTAVFVGPGVDRAAMQQLQRELQEQFQLSGMVVRYEIDGL